MIAQWSFYLQDYWLQVAFSFFYFSLMGVLGTFLILRRAALFGLVTSQAAHLAFLLGMMVTWGGTQEVYGVTHAGQLHRFMKDLIWTDLMVLMTLSGLMIPALILIHKNLRNTDTLFAIFFIAITSLIPLVNAIGGGGDAVLARAYFSELLYTPAGHFSHYLSYQIIITIVLGLLARSFLLASFDPIQARLCGSRPAVISLFFLFFCGVAIAITVRLFGVYLTIAALLLPSMTSLTISGSIKGVLVGAVILAWAYTTIGFLVAFSLANLPANSVLVTTFVALSGVVVLTTKTIRHYRGHLFK